MQYLHQSHYGHAGEFHTARPVMAMQGNHIYDIKNGKVEIDKPLYAVRGDKAYATAFHPQGESPHALFEIKGDRVHTTPFHPMHNPDSHTFEIRSSM
ncbi:MAG TPA: hypothetical protein VMU27_02655 [Candidatus Paceibacterota bacterium]|nr:hypothetical protein [Candidatus Paceibacterota bacterium]